LEAALDGYMQARATGAKDWISYHDGAGPSLANLRQEFGIDLAKPTVTAFTNILWDAQVFYRSNAFPNMLDWLVETIRHFGARSALPLIVGVHPPRAQN